MLEVPEAEYYASRERRQKVFAFCILFSIFPGLTCLLIGLYRLRSPVPGDETPALVAVAVMGGAIVLGCCLALLALPRAGRLAFFRDRAELPRTLVPPWCFLPPRLLPYEAVARWGVGEDTRSDKKVTVLAFNIGAPGSGRTMTFVISDYPNPGAVLSEFRRRLPRPCVVKFGRLFGGVTFHPGSAPGS